VDAIKQLLGIASPSKVFAEMGANMVMGMAQGMTGATGAVLDAASGVANGAISAASGSASLALSASGGASGGTFAGGGVWNGNIIINGAQDVRAVTSAVIQALKDRGMAPAVPLR
jgi:hypothetical protein